MTVERATGANGRWTDDNGHERARESFVPGAALRALESGVRG